MLVALLNTFVATCTAQKLLLLAAHSPRAAIGMTDEVLTGFMLSVLDPYGVVVCATVYATNLSKIKLRLVSEFRSRDFRRKKSPLYAHTRSQGSQLSCRDLQQHGDRDAKQHKLRGRHSQAACCPQRSRGACVCRDHRRLSAVFGPVAGFASEAACQQLRPGSQMVPMATINRAYDFFLLQVRNAQLDKEAAELRRESVELSNAAQEARNGVANSQEASLDIGPRQ